MGLVTTLPGLVAYGLVIALLIAALALASPSRGAGSEAVIVRGGAWTGSGMVWDGPAGLVLTALHVVEGMPDDAIQVVVTGRGALRARVVDREPALDLALLEVAAPLGAGPALGSSAKLSPGDPVSIPGCGSARCGSLSGRVIDPARTFAGSRYVALAVAVAPGASGGPVLDARGAAVGIVDLAFVRPRGTTLAIPIERAAARFLRARIAGPAHQREAGAVESLSAGALAPLVLPEGVESGAAALP